METPESTSGAGLLEPLEPVVNAPPVVAILVTHDPGPWLEETLASLSAQEYPSLSVLVLDNGSTADPTGRIAAVMPRAFVRRLDAGRAFAAAANHALDTVEGATFLLFCHDDAIFEPDAVRVMVEEAYRSNAGIVGPKIVDQDRPEILLEVGMTIDHYGVPYSGIEPHEVDQEQHDAVRDVFYVTHAAMLVRADLFAELGGFDVSTAPDFDDLDLCWRARLAGARVLVAPDARVRHREAATRDERPTAGSPSAITRARTRARIRVLMKTYSPLALLWVLPSALFLNTVEALALLVTGQRGRATGIARGWAANVREIGDVRRARKRAQSLRSIDDSDVRDLMVRGSARVRTLFVQRFHAPDRLQDVSDRTRQAAERASGRLRHPAAIAAVVVAVVLLIGSRDLVFGRVPEIGSFRDWSGVGDLFRTFWSPWQRAGLGVDAPITPAFAFMGLLSSALLGDTGLARTLVVAGAIPLAALGIYRLTRPLARSPFAALTATIAYVVNPLPRNAIAQGHLGSLLLYAFAPFIFGALVRACGTSIGNGALLGQPARRSVVAIGLATAVVTSFFPAGLLFVPLVAAAFALAVPLVGGARFAGRALSVALVSVLLAAALLVPWTFAWFRGDGASLGLAARHVYGLGDVLRFSTGPAGAGWAPYGLLVVAALPLLVATGTRLMWAGRAWILIASSFALAWLPGRLDHGLLRPEPEGVLVAAALGVAVATGIGAAAFVDDLRQFLFGWRQLAAVAAALGLLLPIVGVIGDSVGGRWRLPSRDWAQSVAWMGDEARGGDFRVLWIGDPDVLPAAARPASGTSYGLTRDGAGDVRASFAAPPGKGEPVLSDAIGLLAGQQTARFGHLVAPMGVRYIALVRRTGPHGGIERGYDPQVRAGVAQQLDLAVVQAEPDMLLYENEAWAPARSVVSDKTAISASDGDPITAALRAELEGAAPVRGPLHASRVTATGTFLFADAYDARWHLDGDGARDHHVAFGWSNAYTVSQRGTMRLHYDGSASRKAGIVLEIAAWILVVGWYVSVQRRGRRARA